MYSRACVGGVRSFPGSSLRTPHSTIAPTSSSGPAHPQGCSYFLPWNNVSLSCLSSLALNLLCSSGKPRTFSWLYFQSHLVRTNYRWRPRAGDWYSTRIPIKPQRASQYCPKNGEVDQWGRIEKAVVSQLPSGKEDSLLQIQKQTLKKYILESNPIQKFIPVFGILSPVAKVGL